MRVLNHTSYPLLVPPLLEQSLARSADAMVRAERVGDPVLLFFAADWRAVIAASAGDIDEMDRCYEVTRLLADQLDQPSLKWGLAFFSGVRAQIAGDTDKVERLATEALQIGTDGGEPDAPVYFGAHLANASWQRGTMGELIPLIEQMRADNPGLPALMGTLALAHVEGDRRADARHLLEEFAAADFDLPLDPEWLPGMGDYAEAAIECGDPRCAGPLLDRLAPWADLFVTDGGASASGPVTHYLGGLATVLGRYDEADAYFTQAAAFNEGANAKFFAVRTNLWWGRMLADAMLRATPRRLGTFSPRRTPPPRPTGTRTSSVAPPKHCKT